MSQKYELAQEIPRGSPDCFSPCERVGSGDETTLEICLGSPDCFSPREKVGSGDETRWCTRYLSFPRGSPRNNGV